MRGKSGGMHDMASKRKFMWPFARTSSHPAEAPPEREELTESQLDGTLRYGWNGANADDVKDGVRRLLNLPINERHSGHESPAS